MKEELEKLGFDENLPNHWYSLEFDNEFGTYISVVGENLYISEFNKCDDAFLFKYDLEKIKTLITLLK